MIGKRTTVLILTVLAAAMPAHADVTISTAATENMSCAEGVCAPTAATAVLNVSDLESLLASGSLTVRTTGSGQEARNIRIAAGVVWTTAHALALDAYQSVEIDQPVSVAGAGALSVTTNDGGTGGTFLFGSKGYASFSTLSSALTIDGDQYTLVSSVSSLASAVASHPRGNYALAKNVNASRDGTYNASPVSTTFTGHFNGLGNVISYLSVNDTNQNDDVGLFAEVRNPGSVASLRIKHANVSGRYSLGGIAGLNEGYLLNDYVDGTISAPSGFAGGMVGINYGTVRRGNAAVAIEGETAGGLVAYNCSDCMPHLPGIVKASRASGNVTVNSYNPGTGGGLVGTNLGTIETSWASGSVSGISDTEVGGLVGGSNGSGISNSYATGAVYGGIAGGLIGQSYDNVSDSYSSGPVSGPSGSTLGGFIGQDESNASGHLNDCYWDVTTSGITNPGQGAGNKANDPGITGLTTTELQSGLPAGFVSTVWREGTRINGGLPYLIAFPP